MRSLYGWNALNATGAPDNKDRVVCYMWHIAYKLDCQKKKKNKKKLLGELVRFL